MQHCPSAFNLVRAGTSCSRLGRRGTYLQTHYGVNFFILDSRRVLAAAPKALGPKPILNPDFAPFLEPKRGRDVSLDFEEQPKE